MDAWRETGDGEDNDDVGTSGLLKAAEGEEARGVRGRGNDLSGSDSGVGRWEAP